MRKITYNEIKNILLESEQWTADFKKLDYVSVAKGLDVDKPRNLAKSVTVE